MTDRETLFSYRWKQASETLNEAKKMIDLQFTPRTIINRSYYAMFYTILALFIRKGIIVNSSKHAGIISLFDREFIQKQILDKNLSVILHQAFDDRLEFDYKEKATPDREIAVDTYIKAKSFNEAIADFLEINTSSFS